MDKNYPGSSENERIIPDVIVNAKFTTADIIEKTREVKPKYGAADIKCLQRRSPKKH